MPKTWDYIKGYIKIRVLCNDTERLLNMCIRTKISIWDIHKNSKGFEGLIYIEDLKKLRPVLKRTKSNLRILKKKSLLNFVKNLLKRRFFLFGILIFFSIIIFLNQFIWKVNISSNTPLDLQPIQEILNEYNIIVGKRLNPAIFKQCQIEIIKQCNNIAWVKISKRGSTVSVRLAVAKQIPDIVDANLPCDIVANKNAVVKSIICTLGEKKVEKYQFVKKNQVLISGNVPLFKEELFSANAEEDEGEKRYMRVHSTGEVIGNVYYEKELPLPANASTIQESETRSKAKKLLINEMQSDSVIVKEEVTIYTNSKGIDVLKLSLQCDENIGIDKEIKEKKSTDGKDDKH